MIFYTIIFEQEPFADIEDKSQLTNKIVNGVRPQFLQDVPNFFKELILKCWDADPSNRPTIDELENILLQNPIYEFQYYNFSLNDNKQEFQNMSYISERFYKNSLDTSTSFRLYSEQLLKSIKSIKSTVLPFYITSDLGDPFAFISGFGDSLDSGESFSSTSFHDNNLDSYINFYPIKGDKHRFKKFKTDNHENEFDIINKDQIIDIQMFGDSCINNISSAKMGGVKVIIKKLKNDKNDINQLLLLKKQLNYWNTICKYHDNIVKFLGVISDENETSLILPYAHEGNLRDYLKNNECTLKKKIVIAANIADGILYMHKDLDIIHETLHPKNILMFDGVAKISDLPLPYDKKKFSYYDKYLFDNIGYIDPNLLLNEKFEKDKPMDIYGLGTLLWEIMSEVVPYSKDKGEGILQLVLKIKNNSYREDDISPCGILFPCGYLNIYKKCWNGDSSARPKIEDIYERLILIQDNILKNSNLDTFNRQVLSRSDDVFMDISLDPINTFGINDNVRAEQPNKIERENENDENVSESEEAPSWSKESIALLLIFLIEHKKVVNILEIYNGDIKTKFWNAVAVMLFKNGHNEYNAEQCSVKWKNIKQDYKKNWYKSEVEEILDVKDYNISDMFISY